MGKHTHIYRHAHTPTSHSTHPLNNEQGLTFTHTHTHADKCERWRVSVLSEWMPCLTLLSKCPCVNTADQMAEREMETDRDRERARQKQRCCWRVESRVEGLSYFLTTIPVCLPICLTLSHTYSLALLPSLSYAAGKWVSCHGNNWEGRDLLVY